jgi:hypothetical protein
MTNNQHFDYRRNKRGNVEKRFNNPNPNYRYQSHKWHDNRPYNNGSFQQNRSFESQSKPWIRGNDQGRYKNDRLQDRNSYNPRKFQNRHFNKGKPFEHRNDRFNTGFKVPKHLTTFQQKRRHLKRLRKTAAQLAGGEKPGTFVYKPGMISILRPNTPMNTTQFISKRVNKREIDEDKISPKQGNKPQSGELDRNCVSECDDGPVQCIDCRTGKPHLD